MNKQTLQRAIVILGLALFAGLSILNMQTYLALARVAYQLVQYLPFGWWITPQIIPITIAIMCGAGFFLWRGKKVNPICMLILGIGSFVLFIIGMSTEDMAVSSFGMLLWVASTALQTGPFWVKSTFYHAIVRAFRSQPVEAVRADDSDALKTLTHERNNLPETILKGFTAFAIGANLVDIALGIWQYPPMSWDNLWRLNFSSETIIFANVLAVLLLSVLPEVVLLLVARLLYLCSLTGGLNTKAGKRRSAVDFDNSSTVAPAPGESVSDPWEEGKAVAKQRREARRNQRRSSAAFKF